MTDFSLSEPFRVLVVEDNPADIRLIEEAFEDTGLAYRLDTATDGELALRYFDAVRAGTATVPDLILLDLNLPKINGKQVLARLKADAQWREIPILVLTTSESPIDIQTAYSLHANCYLRKPNDIDDLFRLVQGIREFWLRIVTLPSRTPLPA